MAPTLMGWVVDLVSLTRTGSSIVGTAPVMKTGAIRSVLGCALLRLTGSGPKHGYAEPAWPPPPTVNCARVHAIREVPPPLTWTLRRGLTMHREWHRATLSPSVPRCIAFGSALSPSSSGSGSYLPS